MCWVVGEVGGGEAADFPLAEAGSAGLGSGSEGAC